MIFSIIVKSVSNIYQSFGTAKTLGDYSTAGFIKTVPSVYTLLINTIYLSQVAEGTVFRKHTVFDLPLKKYLIASLDFLLFI